MSIEWILIAILIGWSLFLAHAESKARRERDKLRALAREVFAAQDFVDGSDLGYPFHEDQKWRRAYCALKYETL